VASPSGGQQTLMGRARRRSPAAAAMELTATCPVMCKSAMSRLDRVAASQNGSPIRAARHAAATGGNGGCEVQWPNNCQHGAHPPLPQPLVVTGGRRLDHREVCLVNLSVLVTNDGTRTGRKHLRSVLWNRKSWEKQVELSSPGGQTTQDSQSPPIRESPECEADRFPSVPAGSPVSPDKSRANLVHSRCWASGLSVRQEVNRRLSSTTSQFSRRRCHTRGQGNPLST
jgi:hypothetical protein